VNGFDRLVISHFGNFAITGSEFETKELFINQAILHVVGINVVQEFFFQLLNRTTVDDFEYLEENALFLIFDQNLDELCFLEKYSHLLKV